MGMRPRSGCILVCPPTAEVDGGKPLYGWLLTPCSGAGAWSASAAPFKCLAWTGSIRHTAANFRLFASSFLATRGHMLSFVKVI